jgi:DNA invertase Pin-like site-specific DNA recombinase
MAKAKEAASRGRSSSNQTIGYCRVSTGSQSLDQQIETLRRAGATRLFSEKQSGAKSDRKELARALADGAQYARDR